jgi:ParB/RepB/Spo0J family partition protein
MFAVCAKPVEFFRPDPSNPRKDCNDADLRALGESLLKKQLVPGIAREDGMMIDMHRRWMAAKLVGKKTLDVILVPMDTTPAQIKEIQLITALHKADLKPYEQFCGMKAWLAERPNATAKELTAAIDRSEALVSMTLSLAKCCNAVQEAAKHGKIGLKDWHQMSQVSEGQQMEMLTAKLNGVSTSELKKIRKPLNGAKTSKVKCLLPGGMTVTLVGKGGGVSLGDLINVLTDLLRAAKKANDDGLDAKTFSAVLKDKAKVSQ